VQFCLAHLIREVKFLSGLPDQLTRVYGERVREALRALFRVMHRRETMTPTGFRRALEKARGDGIAAAMGAPRRRHRPSGLSPRRVQDPDRFRPVSPEKRPGMPTATVAATPLSPTTSSTVPSRRSPWNNTAAPWPTASASTGSPWTKGTAANRSSWPSGSASVSTTSRKFRSTRGAGPRFRTTVPDRSPSPPSGSTLSADTVRSSPAATDAGSRSNVRRCRPNAGSSTPPRFTSRGAVFRPIAPMG